MLTLCAWCRRGLKSNGRRMTRKETMILLARNPGEDVSHGVCNRCRRQLFEEAKVADEVRRRIAIEQEKELFSAMIEAAL